MGSKGDVKERLTAYLRELHLPTFRECFEELARRAVQETASLPTGRQATSSTCWNRPSGNARFVG
jgi:hypothetical protein